MRTPLTARRLRATTPLGPMWLAATDAGLAGAWFDDQRDPPSAQALARWPERPTDPVLCASAQWLADYFSGAAPAWTLPLDLSAGTAFQQAVWGELLRIGHGDTVSYGAVARAIDRPQAVRAVGAAVGANPLCIVVPCHRVVGSGGALTGYSAGMHRKIALLELEAPAASARLL